MLYQVAKTSSHFSEYYKDVAEFSSGELGRIESKLRANHRDSKWGFSCPDLERWTWTTLSLLTQNPDQQNKHYSSHAQRISQKSIAIHFSGLYHMMKICNMEDKRETPFHRDKYFQPQNKEVRAVLLSATGGADLLFLSHHIGLAVFSLGCWNVGSGATLWFEQKESPIRYPEQALGWESLKPFHSISSFLGI